MEGKQENTRTGYVTALQAGGRMSGLQPNIRINLPRPMVRSLNINFYDELEIIVRKTGQKRPKPTRNPFTGQPIKSREEGPLPIPQTEESAEGTSSQNIPRVENGER